MEREKGGVGCLCVAGSLLLVCALSGACGVDNRTTSATIDCGGLTEEERFGSLSTNSGLIGADEEGI